jgi:hypothetical protein
VRLDLREEDASTRAFRATRRFPGNPPHDLPIQARMKTSTNAAVAVVPDASSRDERISISSRRVSLVAEAEGTAPVPAPIWEPVAQTQSVVPRSSEVLHPGGPNQDLAPDLEKRLIATLTRPLGLEESHQIGNDNREGELRSYIENLSPIEAFVLRRRLDADRSNDTLAVAFRRLVVERRVRLKALLADPRRGRR